MSIKLAAASGANDSFTFAESAATGTLRLDVRANDGRNSGRSIYSLDNGQSADLAVADPVGDPLASPDRSALGATIWINADGTVSYSAASIQARIDALAPGEVLQDSFLYALRTSTSSGVWSSVTLTFTGTNDAPVASMDVAAVAEGSVLSGNIADNDRDVDNGAVLRFEKVGPDLVAGFVLGTNGAWTFDANAPAYNGLGDGETKLVVVQYRVTDQFGASSTSTLTLTVAGTNDAPRASLASSPEQLEEGQVVSGRLFGADVDAGAVLTFVAAGDLPPGITIAPDGSYRFDSGHPAYQSLAAGEMTGVTLAYRVVDEHGAYGFGTVQFTVHGTNDGPIATPASASLSEDGRASGQLNASDPDGGAVLRYDLSEQAPEGFVLSTDGSWSLDASGPAWQSLSAGEARTVQVPFTVSDGQGGSSSAVLTLTVTGTNDAAVVSGTSLLTLSEDEGHAGATIRVADPDAGQAGLAADRYVQGQFGNAWFGTSEPLAAGEARWTYEITDSAAVQALGLGDTLSENFTVASVDGTPLTFTVVLTGANDAPVAHDGAAMVEEDGTVAGQLVASDVDRGAAVSFALVGSAPAGFTLAPDGSWSLDTTYAEYQSLATGETMTITLPYVATDEHGASSQATLTLTITGTNDRPVTTFPMEEVSEGQSASGQLMAIDVDAGAILSFILDGAVPAGFSLAVDGSWTFDASNPEYDSLAAGAVRILNVPFTARDEHGAETSAQFILAVTGTNDGPHLVQALEDRVFSEDSAFTFTLAEGSFADADGDTPGLSATLANGDPLPDWLSFDPATGTFAGTPPTDWHGLIDVQVTASDGLLSASDGFKLSFTPVNDAPVLSGVAASLPTGSEDISYTLTSAQLLQGWSDPEGGTLSIANLSASNGARITANSNGTYTVTPAANWNGTLQLSYGVGDGSATTPASLSLAFAAVNDWPRLTGTAYVVPAQVEDVSFTVTAAQLLQGWTDVDGDNLRIWTIGTAGGNVTDNGNGTYTVRPAANATGAARLDYTVYDGRTTISASLNYNLQAVNDPAVISGDVTGRVSEDGASASIVGLLYAADVDNTSNSFMYVSSTTTAAGYGSFSITAQGRWSYWLNNANPAVNALDDGQTLTDSFVVRSADGTQQTVTITISGLSDNAYVAPAISTAADANDFDLLNVELTRPSTLWNFYGTAAGETHDGANGNDNMYGQGGADVIYGHGGSDGLYGELATSNMPPAQGEPGDDTLYGQAGNDGLWGGVGNDRLYGGSGADVLYGHNGQSALDGPGDDWLFGGSGNDRLYGQDGTDVLVGGTGLDHLYGGAGADRFVYTSAADTGDWIFDFQRGTDRIDLSAFGLDPTKFLGPIAPGMVGAGEVGFRVYNGGTQMETYIYVDTDRVPGADLELRLIGVNGVDASDFIW